MSLQEILNSEMDLASVSAAAGRAWRWWVAELAAMLPPAWRSGLSSRPRLFAEREASGWRYWRDGEPLADDRPPPGAQRGPGLLLPGEAVLVRRIEVPRMPPADVRRMLALDIDRLSPLGGGLIHFDSEVIDRDGEGGKQTLLLGIVRRAAARQLVETAGAEGLSPAALSVRLDGDGEPQRFDFLPAVREAAGERPAANARPWWWAAVGVLFLLNFAVLVGRDMASVSHLKKLVDSQRPAAEAAMRLRLRVDREQARREDLVRRGSASEPLRMLAALTGALPKGAWVQRLEWNGQAIRIVGSKSGELDMPAAIRGSGFFTNPRPLTAASAPRPESVQPFDITADARARTRA